MVNLDIDFADEVIKGVRSLAVRHYGDSGDASISRVVESALEMRLLSIKLAERGGNEIEEPIASWEFANKQPAEQLPTEIRSWLFRGGNQCFRQGD
jgi:hypothetical protein